MSRSASAQTKAGARTPATPASPRPLACLLRPRSTKAGARTPATPPRRPPSSRSRRPLKRRPGHAPRRHAAVSAAGLFRLRRSTKAGALTPATPRARLEVAPVRARSTKAGARTPATPDHQRGGRRAGRRSTKAGARTPATLERTKAMSQSMIAQRRPGHAPRRHSGSRRMSGRRASSLNEGRGTHPGHTRMRSLWLGVGPGRSTKAGARTPATHETRLPERRARAALNEGRGTHPGDTRPAYTVAAAYIPLNEGRGTHPGDTGRQDAVDDGRVARSTKAGARTPATRPVASPASPAPSTLNEGRGTHPGDTRSLPHRGIIAAGALNEGRGTHPGDTSMRRRPHPPGP